MFKATLAVAVLTSFLAAPALAQVGADLNISPRRVTLDDSERAATVYVFNQGDEPATYTVELVDRIMQPDGQIVALVDATDAPHSASAQQVIRVRVRPPAVGASAEYRTHLTVTALPPEDTGFTAAQAAEANPNGVALQVTALFSVSIPLIVREGAVAARAASQNVSRLPASEGATHGALVLDLVRLGANSVYGDVEVHAGQGATDRVVGLVPASPRVRCAGWLGPSPAGVAQAGSTCSTSPASRAPGSRTTATVESSSHATIATPSGSRTRCRGPEPAGMAIVTPSGSIPPSVTR